MNGLWKLIDKPFKPGTILSNYCINEFIGMGSYGLIYHATSNVSGIEVIIKQLRTRKRTKNGVASFEKEKELLQLLSHPSLPTFIDYFQYQNRPFLVMSRMNGQPLDTLLFEKHKAFSKHEGFQLIENVLEVVHYVHCQKIVHLDLRPPNILVENQQISIIDFGLADFINSPVKKASNSLMRETQPKSDFYALGHTLLFILYSGFIPQTKKKRSWEEELNLSNEEKFFIRRLLQIEEPFTDTSEALTTVRLLS
ncbi:serine/threonine protein kinase [Ferdinandcohnia sp. Marseille-Q9671]